ncbi:hypothetical protein [Pedobacter suwonensis]|uniref:hypothetical protein n=1 Tax=Pedobacter suwonensis TaxID=332999 RepID=UPI0036850A2D
MTSKSFKTARKKDVTDYLQILANYGVYYRSLDFKDALSDALWGYSIQGLTIPVEKTTLKHIRPMGFSAAEVIVEIDVESNISEWDNLNDPFTNLSFRSLMKGTNTKTNKVHYLSFHVDRHNGAKTNEVHPLYHLQYLQNAKSKPKDEFDHGESLQLDIPRMMHFPMELILGVSFLLSNYAPLQYAKLVKDRQYINLCREYQHRVWRPYINSLENYWTTPLNQRIWDAKLNCPYLQ